MITLAVNDKELQFEHSLVSLSAWEAEYEKPFFPRGDEEKTNEEMVRYFEHMLVGRSRKHAALVMLLSPEQQLELATYISKGSTATTVREARSSGPADNVTSELIYYWLVAFRIPFQPTETWHLNRLLMLVKVCGAKQAEQAPAEKETAKSRQDRAMEMRAINEARRAKLKTKG